MKDIRIQIIDTLNSKNIMLFELIDLENKILGDPINTRIAGIIRNEDKTVKSVTFSYQISRRTVELKIPLSSILEAGDGYLHYIKKGTDEKIIPHEPSPPLYLGMDEYSG